MDPGGTAVSLSSTHAGSSAAVEPVEPPLNCFKFLQQQFAVSHPQSSAAAELCHGSVTNYRVLEGTRSALFTAVQGRP